MDWIIVVCVHVCVAVGDLVVVECENKRDFQTKEIQV